VLDLLEEAAEPLAQLFAERNELGAAPRVPELPADGVADQIEFSAERHDQIVETHEPDHAIILHDR
jgi:hypothetical protein